MDDDKKQGKRNMGEKIRNFFGFGYKNDQMNVDEPKNLEYCSQANQQHAKPLNQTQDCQSIQLEERLRKVIKERDEARFETMQANEIHQEQVLRNEKLRKKIESIRKTLMNEDARIKGMLNDPGIDKLIISELKMCLVAIGKIIDDDEC